MPTFNQNDLNYFSVKEGIKRTEVHLENLMMVIIEFSNGPMADPDIPHSHPHEQITYVEDGEIFIFIDTKKHFLKKGGIYVIPSGISHSIQTLTPYVKLIDTFSPIRTDLIQ